MAASFRAAFDDVQVAERLVAVAGLFQQPHRRGVTVEHDGEDALQLRRAPETVGGEDADDAGAETLAPVRRAKPVTDLGIIGKRRRIELQADLSIACPRHSTA